MNAKDKRKWTKVGSAAAVLTVGLVINPRPMKALFGFGDIVFDPTSYATLGHIWAEDISTGAKVMATYNESVKIFENGMQIYKLADAMAQRVQNKQVWKLAAFAVGNEGTENHYNEQINFNAAMNGDVLHAAQAWHQSTFNQISSGYLGNATPNNSVRMSEYATIQLLDQTSQRCAGILANYKQMQDSNQTPENELQNDTIDESDAKNSSVAVLNVLSGGQLQLKTQERANGNLQACLAEQKTLEAKLQRDRLAEDQTWYGDIASEKASAPALVDPDKTAYVVGGGYLVP